MPDHLLSAGRLRLEHKQASLEELGQLADPPMTKDAVAGRIEDVYYRLGETAGAAQPVVSLLAPENLKLRFFVPEPDRDRALGDPAASERELKALIAAASLG